MRQSYCLSLLLGFVLLAGCNPAAKEGDLPYLGNKHAEDVVEIDPVTLDTLTRKDTVYHQIASFSFLNQEGKAITNDEVGLFPPHLPHACFRGKASLPLWQPDYS